MNLMEPNGDLKQPKRKLKEKDGIQTNPKELFLSKIKIRVGCQVQSDGPRLKELHMDNLSHELVNHTNFRQNP